MRWTCSIVIPSSPSDDRRQDCRLQVRRPCRVSPLEGDSVEIAGVTYDISRSGMLIAFPDGSASTALPQVGDHARILIDLPREAGFPPRCLEHMARVVRITGQDTGEPAVAFEVYRVGIKARRERGQASARGLGKQSPGGYIQ